jgi:hypothetical protein
MDVGKIGMRAKPARAKRVGATCSRQPHKENPAEAGSKSKEETPMIGGDKVIKFASISNFQSSTLGTFAQRVAAWPQR